ncbi:uncharacterized protein LOC113324596 [Papaver somniferum]|uniref:uncharacterized protein LOC113324596 n=1 Tax=Papaver somniferum TaxID=3469 RepID=UPI000E6F4B4D|nr:uncharacterized protein LOC113324596 [Papaver somniferum]
MKIISWNVQGLKSVATRNHLSDLIRTQNPDIIFLCETKTCQDKSKPVISHYQYPNQAFIEPVGLSGGLVILWKNGFTCELLMFNLVVQHEPSKPEFLLSCVYGYPSFAKKKDQWNYIQQIGSNHNGPWILIGDLNFHLRDDNTRVSSSANGFVIGIINYYGLEDIGYVGKDYTWTRNNLGTGTRRLRIDMALGNVYWNLNYPNSKLMHLTQVSSDHSPIMLVSDSSIPKCWKSFKFFLTWLNDEACVAVIEKAWKISISGSPGYQLIEWLQSTRKELSLWNKSHFGNVNQKVYDLQKELATLQAQPPSYVNHNKILSINKDLNNWHKRERNSIIKNPEIASLIIWTTIANLFRILPAIISEDGNLLLMTIPSHQEIHDTLKSVEKWSAPGLEGFQAGFYKSQWNIIGEYVCQMITRFFETKHILKQIKKTYIPLTPKKKTPTCAADYRPIGLCNTTYKIISKLIVKILKPLIEKIISPYQAAYVTED